MNVLDLAFKGLGLDRVYVDRSYGAYLSCPSVTYCRGTSTVVGVLKQCGHLPIVPFGAPTFFALSEGGRFSPMLFTVFAVFRRDLC